MSAPFIRLYDRLSRTLKSDVGISSDIYPLAKDIITLEGLWDTGATCSMIKKDVAERLNLTAVSQTEIHSPTGSRYCDQYYVNLHINDITIPKVLITNGLLFNSDILIGMDIITQGDFIESNAGGTTKFVFRIPPSPNMSF